MAFWCISKLIHRKWSSTMRSVISSVTPHYPQSCTSYLTHLWLHFPRSLQVCERHIWSEQLSPTPDATASSCTLKSWTHSVLYTLSFFVASTKMKHLADCERFVVNVLMCIRALVCVLFVTKSEESCLGDSPMRTLRSHSCLPSSWDK